MFFPQPLQVIFNDFTNLIAGCRIFCPQKEAVDHGFVRSDNHFVKVNSVLNRAMVPHYTGKAT